MVSDLTQMAGSRVLNGYMLSGRLRDGDTITIQPVLVEDLEKYRNVGEYNFELTEQSIRITDRTGRDVTGQYGLSYAEPCYTILPRPLSISVYGDYEEDPSIPGMRRMQWSISDGSLAPGHKLEVYRDDSDRDDELVYHLGKVGDHMICVKILDENGGNVTDNYDLSSSNYN